MSYMAYVAVVVLLMIGTNIIHANESSNLSTQNLTLDSLMKKRASIKETWALFKEKKITSAFSKPLLLEGKLFYRSPDSLIKHYTSPDEIRYEAIKNTIIIETHDILNDEIEQQQINLDRIPILNAFITALRGTLSGNIIIIREFFDLKYASNHNQWKITLVPKNESIRKKISTLVLGGKNESLLRVEINETSGDSTVTVIQPHDKSIARTK